MQPGALRWFDADDLAAALAPLPQWIGDTRNARLQTHDQKTLSRHYRWATTRYHAGPLQLSAGQTESQPLARWIKRHVPSAGK